MKYYLFVAYIFLAVTPVRADFDPVWATQYNAYKPALTMREAPNAESKIIGKIPYGSPVEIYLISEGNFPAMNEGLQGSWRKVKYDNIQGYVVDMYLLDIPPPKTTVQSMDDYFRQLSRLSAKPIEYTRGVDQRDSSKTYTKNVYVNGNESIRTEFYETAYITYYLPGFCAYAFDS